MAQNEDEPQKDLVQSFNSYETSESMDLDLSSNSDSTPLERSIVGLPIEESSSVSGRHPACQFRADKIWLDRQYHDSEHTSIMKPDEIEAQMDDPPKNYDDTLLNRIKGSMFGLAIGDALGAHVEFRPREYLRDHPVTEMIGGGTWGLNKGQFTDDTSMALCLANSLIARQDFAPYDQLVRYKWWHENGYMSSTGNCFDIGSATANALREFRQRQTTFSAQHGIPIDDLDYLSDKDLLEEFDVYCSEDGAAGNGALMRLAPVPLFCHVDPKLAVEYSGISGKITHGDKKAYDSCRYYGALIVAALRGETKEQLLNENFYDQHRTWFNDDPIHEDVMSIIKGSFKKAGGYDDGIRGKGYIVNALEAALWTFWADKGSFETGVLAAVSLGDDTDTTAAIYGQLAGAYYGYAALPVEWVDTVYAKKFIETLSKWINYEAHNRTNEFNLISPPNSPSSNPNQIPSLSEIDGETIPSFPPTPYQDEIIPSPPSFSRNKSMTTSLQSDDNSASLTHQYESLLPPKITVTTSSSIDSQSLEARNENKLSNYEYLRDYESEKPTILTHGDLAYATKVSTSESTTKRADDDVKTTYRKKNSNHESYVGKQSSSSRLKSTSSDLIDSVISWSADEVCQYIQSLNTNFANYGEIFRREDFDGYRLIEFTTREVLSRYGITDSSHQTLILDRIRELKERFIKCGYRARRL